LIKNPDLGDLSIVFSRCIRCHRCMRFTITRLAIVLLGGGVHEKIIPIGKTIKIRLCEVQNFINQHFTLTIMQRLLNFDKNLLREFNTYRTIVKKINSTQIRDFRDSNLNRKLYNKKLSLIAFLQANGTCVPHYCYHDDLSIVGNCRVCIVELKTSLKPTISCAINAKAALHNNLLYHDSILTKKARENILEFLLLNHPLDCPICDQGGDCDLQDQSLFFGITKRRYYNYKRIVIDKNLGPIIKTVMTRCIHCTRCIRFATEITGIEELGVFGRSSSSEIGTYIEKMLLSELSGNVIDLCPVGYTTSSRSFAFRTIGKSINNNYHNIVFLKERFRSHPFACSYRSVSDGDSWGIDYVLKKLYDRRWDKFLRFLENERTYYRNNKDQKWLDHIQDIEITNYLKCSSEEEKLKENLTLIKVWRNLPDELESYDANYDSDSENVWNKFKINKMLEKKERLYLEDKGSDTESDQEDAVSFIGGEKWESYLNWESYPDWYNYLNCKSYLVGDEWKDVDIYDIYEMFKEWRKSCEAIDTVRVYMTRHREDIDNGYYSNRLYNNYVHGQLYETLVPLYKCTLSRLFMFYSRQQQIADKIDLKRGSYLPVLAYMITIVEGSEVKIYFREFFDKFEYAKLFSKMPEKVRRAVKKWVLKLDPLPIRCTKSCYKCERTGVCKMSLVETSSKNMRMEKLENSSPLFNYLDGYYGIITTCPGCSATLRYCIVCTIGEIPRS